MRNSHKNERDTAVYNSLYSMVYIQYNLQCDMIES